MKQILLEVREQTEWLVGTRPAEDAPPVVVDGGREVGEADFAADPEKDRQTVNGWVAQQTNARVKDLLDGVQEAWSRWSTREGIRNLPENFEPPSD